MLAVSFSNEEKERIPSVKKQNESSVIARIIDYPAEDYYPDGLFLKFDERRINGLETKELTGSLEDRDKKKLISDLTMMKILYPAKSKSEVFKVISDFENGEAAATSAKPAKSVNSTKSAAPLRVLSKSKGKK